MQYMIKRLYTSEETTFVDSKKPEDTADLAHTVHKLLQNYHYHDEGRISSYIYRTNVYARKDNSQIWQLIFSSDTSEPEDEPLKGIDFQNENV